MRIINIDALLPDETEAEKRQIEADDRGNVQYDEWRDIEYAERLAECAEDALWS